MWRSDIVTPDPDSLGVVWEGGSKYAGKVTIYDYEIYIADAAVYLMTTKPELGIKDPYALDATQFQAAVDLLKEQRKNITTVLESLLGQVDEFTNGRHDRRDDLADPGQQPDQGERAGQGRR